jgi:Mce-associated membrane protein
VTEKRTSVEERRPPKPTPRKRRIRRSTIGTILPWAVAALAAAAAVTFAILWLGARSGAAQEEEVVSTARRFLQALTNFSAETIEEDVDQIRGFAVGQFANEVNETFSEDRVRAISDSEAVSTGRVQSVFIQSLTGSTGTVFGVVRETIVNTTLPAPRVDLLRIELGMIETPEGWRVSSVEILQSPGAGLFG